ATLDLEHAGTRRTLRAGFVVDASGPRGALSRLLRLPKLPLRWLPPTQALYTHFEGVARWDSLVPLPAASCQPPATPSQLPPGPRPPAPELPPELASGPRPPASELAPGPWPPAPELAPDPPFP